MQRPTRSPVVSRTSLPAGNVNSRPVASCSSPLLATSRMGLTPVVELRRAPASGVSYCVEGGIGIVQPTVADTFTTGPRHANVPTVAERCSGNNRINRGLC